MEEYLTTHELCQRIKYQKQTVYNLIHKKVFVAGKHFVKPTPKKILFKWSEIRAWIGDNRAPVAFEIDETIEQHNADDSHGSPAKDKPMSLIRI